MQRNGHTVEFFEKAVTAWAFGNLREPSGRSTGILEVFRVITCDQGGSKCFMGAKETRSHSVLST